MIILSLFGTSRGSAIACCTLSSSWTCVSCMRAAQPLHNKELVRKRTQERIKLVCSLISFRTNMLTRLDQSSGCTVARGHICSIVSLRTDTAALAIGHRRTVELLRQDAGERLDYGHR